MTHTIRLPFIATVFATLLSFIPGSHSPATPTPTASAANSAAISPAAGPAMANGSATNIQAACDGDFAAGRTATYEKAARCSDQAWVQQCQTTRGCEPKVVAWQLEQRATLARQIDQGQLTQPQASMLLTQANNMALDKTQYDLDDVTGGAVAELDFAPAIIKPGADKTSEGVAPAIPIARPLDVTQPIDITQPISEPEAGEPSSPKLDPYGTGASRNNDDSWR